jgi:hypothetical protein
MHSFIPIVLITLTLIGCGDREQKGDQEPGEDPGGSALNLLTDRWPGEGVPVLGWQGPGDSLEIYSRPGDTSPADPVSAGTGKIIVTAGQRLTWDRSAIRIEQPGQLEITEDCIVSGFVYDPPRGGRLESGRAREIYFPAGTFLDVICYAAEGYYILRHQGEYIEMGVEQPCQLMLSEPQTRWWVRITGDGRPVGWIPVDGNDVAVIDRRF